jgi:hypothetical protein
VDFALRVLVRLLQSFLVRGLEVSERRKESRLWGGSAPRSHLGIQIPIIPWSCYVLQRCHCLHRPNQVTKFAVQVSEGKESENERAIALLSRDSDSAPSYWWTLVMSDPMMQPGVTMGVQLKLGVLHCSTE